MKFRFNADLTFEASDVETALGHVASHISTVKRHVANGVKLEDAGALFSLVPAEKESDVVDIRHDAYVAENGPHDLNLDPESERGIAHADRKAAQKADDKSSSK